MKQWRRLAFFLLLNILISACTTLAVLIIWDQTRTPLPGGLIQPIVISLPRAAAPAPTDAPSPTAALVSTPTPLLEFHTVEDGDTFESIAQTYGITEAELVAANGYTQSQILSPGELLRVPIRPVIIESVIGAGDLETEHIMIYSNIAGELSLAGWQVEDNMGNSFTFPLISLFVKERPIELYTKAGVDSAEQLFWGLQSPIWRSGSIVTLRDERGKIQASYTVP